MRHNMRHCMRIACAACLPFALTLFARQPLFALQPLMVRGPKIIAVSGALHHGVY